VSNDLNTVLTTPYVELDDHILPALGWFRADRAGRKPALTDTELLCLAVAEQLLESSASGSGSATPRPT
jgi:hypothetical protein